MNVQKRRFSLFWLTAVFFGTGVWSLTRPVLAAQAAPVKVVASIFSLADMAKNIGGDQVETATILPSGGNPHTFELNPGKARALEGAKVIFTIGHGFDDWLRPAEESFPAARIVTVDTDIDLIKDGAVDPHYWLSLKNARRIAENIAKELGALVSDREAVEANLERYLKKLNETDHQIKDLFSDLENRKLVTAHNAWGYFARDYGLEILGSVESEHHGEPTPSHLVGLARLVRKDQVRALFIQPQIPKDVVEAFAQDFHLRIYNLDPAESPGKDADYAGLMLQNARAIKQALER